MGLLLLGWGAAAVLAAEWVRVDYSALDPEASGYPVAHHGRSLCGYAGADDGVVLAAAIITYGRRPGPSAWGHTSLRFLACEDGLLRDVEYEYYRMGGATQDWFRDVFPDAAWTADRAYLRRQRDRLVILRNERPVDGGFFARDLRKNREIIEAWMPWSPALRQQLYTDLDARYSDQIDQMSARTDLNGPRYAWWRSNCTLHIREALAAEAGGEVPVAGSVFPMRNLTALEARDDVRFVVHPSPHTLGPDLVDGTLSETLDVIPRGLFRRSGDTTGHELVQEALPEAVPVVVEWLLEDAASI